MNANPVITSILQVLEPLGLKQTGPDQYRSNSPFRPGSDSLSFSITVDLTSDSGAFMDHVSGETGSLYQLVERLGILLSSNRKPVANSKRLYVNLSDYA